MVSKGEAQRGFTLIEVMLVMVLVSVSAVAVVITLPADSEDIVRTRTEQLYQRVTMLHQDAMLNGWDLGIRVDEAKNRYQFLRLSGEGWELLDHRRIPAETEIEQGINLALNVGGSVWGEQESLFEQGSLFDEEMFAELEEDKVLPPQVLILSSGELTPFVMHLYPSNVSEGEDNWRLEALENGQFQLLAPGEALYEESL